MLSDIVIGFTILAYRYEGLRRGGLQDDFRKLVRNLKKSMGDEQGPHVKRPSSRRYVKWVELAGGRCRGTSSKEDDDAKRKAEIESKGLAAVQSTAFFEGGGSINHTGDVDEMFAKREPPPAGEKFDDLWTLPLLNIHDDDQMDLMYELLGRHCPTPST